MGCLEHPARRRLFPPRHREAEDQRFNLCVDRRASWRLARLGAVKLLGDELAVPDKHRVRFDEGSHLRQGLLAPLLANLGECLALGASPLHTTGDLLAQETILGDQVFMASQEFLVHGSRDVCSQRLPIQTWLPLPLCRPYGR
jgi:hypothetical protein